MSILKKLQIGMMLFGIAMGCIFPVYAGFFVQYKPGMQLWFTLGCVVAGIAVGVFSYLLVKIILIKQLLKISQASDQVAAGNINISIDLQSDDTVGSIVAGFNRMLHFLRDLLSRMASGTTQLNNVSARLAATNDNLLEIIDRHQPLVVTANSSTLQATETMKSISDHLLAADKHIRETNQQATQATSLLNDSATIMATATRSMDQTIQHVQELNKQSANISNIISIIDTIAQQTNLLALNASVEAARAGSHGKGFAVVAEEVRSLAIRTKQATNEITVMLEKFSMGVDQTLKGVEQHAENNTSLNTKLTQTANDIGNVVSGIDRMSQMVHQITNDASRQTEAFRDIRDSISGTSTAFDLVRKFTDEVIDSSSEIKNFSEGLLTLLNQCKISTKVS